LVFWGGGVGWAAAWGELPDLRDLGVDHRRHRREHHCEVGGRRLRLHRGGPGAGLLPPPPLAFGPARIFTGTKFYNHRSLVPRPLKPNESGKPKKQTGIRMGWEGLASTPPPPGGPRAGRDRHRRPLPRMMFSPNISGAGPRRPPVGSPTVPEPDPPGARDMVCRAWGERGDRGNHPHFGDTPNLRKHRVRCPPPPSRFSDSALSG